MGRMLETLKQGEGRRAMPAIDKTAPETPVQDCVVDWEIGEEVPFVEVGGPNKKVELSPGLMAHPAQVAPQPPHQPAKVAIKPKAVQFTQTQPMAVAFEAMPTASTQPRDISAEIIAYHQPEHATSKEYAALLDAMLQNLHGNGTNVLLLVGVRPRVGASTVLLNLAAIAGMQKKLRVVLVEASGPHAGLSQLVGQSPRAGLDDVLAGSLGIERALMKTPIDTLQLLPAGDRQRAFTAEGTAWLCSWLRERYDLILIDGPTLENLSQLSSLVPTLRGSIWCCRKVKRSTRRRRMRSIDWAAACAG